MVHRNRLKIFAIIALLACSSFVGVAVWAEDYGLSATAGHAGLDKYSSDLPTIVGQIVGAGLSLTGVLFFSLMIYSGIIWMIDRGNDERAEQAKNTITAAVIGLVIVLAAYAITRFAFEAVPKSGGGGAGGPGGGGGSSAMCGDASGVCAGLSVGAFCTVPGSNPNSPQATCVGPLPVCTCAVPEVPRVACLNRFGECTTQNQGECGTGIEMSEAACSEVAGDCEAADYYDCVKSGVSESDCRAGNCSTGGNSATCCYIGDESELEAFSPADGITTQEQCLNAADSNAEFLLNVPANECMDSWIRTVENCKEIFGNDAEFCED